MSKAVSRPTACANCSLEPEPHARGFAVVTYVRADLAVYGGGYEDGYRAAEMAQEDS